MEKNFKQFLNNYFKNKGVNNIEKKKNLNLIEHGIIDSLDIVTPLNRTLILVLSPSRIKLLIFFNLIL